MSKQVNEHVRVDGHDNTHAYMQVCMSVQTQVELNIRECVSCMHKQRLVSLFFPSLPSFTQLLTHIDAHMHKHTHIQTNYFPPHASLILLSHLVIHLSHFPFPSCAPANTLLSNAHSLTLTHIHTSPSPSVPLRGSPQYELAEMYS